MKFDIHKKEREGLLYENGASEKIVCHSKLRSWWTWMTFSYSTGGINVVIQKYAVAKISGEHTHTHTHTHKPITITPRLRARVNQVTVWKIKLQYSHMIYMMSSRSTTCMWNTHNALHQHELNYDNNEVKLLWLTI